MCQMSPGVGTLPGFPRTCPGHTHASSLSLGLGDLFNFLEDVTELFVVPRNGILLLRGLYTDRHSFELNRFAQA